MPLGTVDDVKAAYADFERLKQTHPEALRAVETFWRAHFSKLGHKQLGRMLNGWDAQRLLAEHEKGGKKDD